LEDNIIMDLQQVGNGGMEWIELAPDRDCGNELSSFIKGGEFVDLLKTCWVLMEESAPWSR
jgi:hypothetical protein